MSSKPTVYLAGGITGLSFKGCTDWRRVAADDLAEVGIRALDPMRGKEYLAHVEKFTMDGDKYKEVHGVHDVMSTNRGIVTRDRFDTTRCDMVLVNFLGAERVSIGTCMEIAWADLSRTPIVCVLEPGNPHEHGMILEAIGFRVATLEEALHIIKATLL